MTTTPTSAPTLRQVQQWMAGVIADPQRLETLDGRFAQCLAVPAGADVAERLQVYAGGYPARIAESLRESFPAVAHVVGRGAFTALTQRFAMAVPLGSYTLGDAGLPLPEFLHEDQLTRELPFLPDLARLEWHIAQAFHATDRQPFDVARATSWDLEDWAAAVLRFQPWVSLVTSSWPIREIWACRETPIADIDIDLRNRVDHVLVRRAGFAVACESLAPDEAEALKHLLNGQPLGAVMDALAASGNDPGAVSAWFTRWLSLRMIVDCSR